MSSLFGSTPTMVFDGVSQPTKPSVEAGRPAGSSDAKSAKAKKAKKDGKKDGKAPKPASAEEEPSKKAAKASAGTPAAAAGESPSVPKQSKKRAADKAADAADDDAAGGAAEKDDDKKPNRKQRAAGEWAEMNARTVFVGNLPVDDDSHQKKLRRHFAQFGAVDSVRIRSAAASDPSMPKKAAVITGALDRQIRDSYNAYVVFTEASSVAQAVATNGALFEGRYLRIDRVTGAGAGSSAPSTQDTKCSVFLGNLPFNVQEDELRKLLARCGEVENVRLVRDPATQHGKGFGYVHFKEAGSVEIALGLHEKVKLMGPDKKERPVRIFRCTAAKSNKRAREAAPAAGGKGGKAAKPADGKGGGKGGKGGKPSGGKKGGKAPIGRTGAAGGYLERARQRVVKETNKEIKPKMSAAKKMKKERKDKVNRKRDQKDSKRSGGKLASSIGKKSAAKAAASKKSAKKPSKM